MRYLSEMRVGEIALTLTGSEKNDNVTTIPTILKTGTYEKSAQLTVPFPAIFGTSEKPANLWPAVQLVHRSTKTLPFMPIRNRTFSIGTAAGAHSSRQYL